MGQGGTTKRGMEATRKWGGGRREGETRKGKTGEQVALLPGKKTNSQVLTGTGKDQGPMPLIHSSI